MLQTMTGVRNISAVWARCKTTTHMAIPTRHWTPSMQPNRAFSTSSQPYTATALPAHSSCRHCNFVLSAVWRPANDFQHEEMMVPHLSRVLLVATTRRMPKVSQRPASPCRLVVAKMSYVPCPDAWGANRETLIHQEIFGHQSAIPKQWG
jgi:hypothetical protein